jgi:Ca2+-binding RTX toxin-like protein
MDVRLRTNLGGVRSRVFAAALVALPVLALAAAGPASAATVTSGPGSDSSFTAAVGVVANNLTVTFNSGTSTVSYVDSAEGITVSGLCAGGGAIGVAATCPATSVSRITVMTGDGNDTITTNGNGPDYQLLGGPGADAFVGNTLTDTVSYAGSTTAVNIGLSGSPNTGGDALGDVYTGIENLTGSEADDSISGDAGPNHLLGNGGNDIMAGGAGADNLIGGDGNDLLTGGSGADVMDGGPGSDFSLYTGSPVGVGVDLNTNPQTGGDAAGDVLSTIENLVGSNNDDTLTGDANANALQGEGGHDTISGGDNGDVLNGGPGADTMDGGLGSDFLEYGDSPAGVTVNLATQTVSGADAAGDVITSIEDVFGSNFDDTITGDDNANFIFGRDGADTIVGAGGVDQLSGDDGNDNINSRDGTVESPNCGNGDDSIVADPTDNVNADCETVDRTLPSGPTGPTGPTGPSTPTGPTGPTGPTTPVPVYTKTSNLGRTTGTVTFTKPGGKVTKLTSTTLVPTGTTVNTTKGTVTVTSRARAGNLQSAQFSLGTFKLNLKTTDGATEAGLTGPTTQFRKCSASHRFLTTTAKTASAAKKRKAVRRTPIRRLFGSGKGRFRTKGYYGSATVRGTHWLVEDYCDGTKITVTTGFVDVNDFAAKKTVRVKARGSYFARKVPLKKKSTAKRR